MMASLLVLISACGGSKSTAKDNSEVESSTNDKTTAASVKANTKSAGEGNVNSTPAVTLSDDKDDATSDRGGNLQVITNSSSSQTVQSNTTNTNTDRTKTKSSDIAPL